MRQSARSFTETVGAVKASIEAHGFKIAATIDHAAAAAAAGETLPPTTLLIFGNPKGGSPLMRAAPTIAIDLPLKALIFERADGAVILATPDIDALFAEHGLSQLAAPKNAIKKALDEISADAAGNN